MQIINKKSLEKLEGIQYNGSNQEDLIRFDKSLKKLKLQVGTWVIKAENKLELLEPLLFEIEYGVVQ